MKVLYLCKNYTRLKDEVIWDGSAWYRCQLPAKWLASELGWEVIVAPLSLYNKRTGALCGELAEGGIVDDADLVVVKDFFHGGDDYAGPKYADEQIRRARAGGQVVIADTDDWLMGTPKDHVFTKAFEKRADKNVQQWKAALLACDAITVSTPALARFIGAWRGAPPIHVIRNAIDADAWYQVEPSDTERPTFGWCGNPNWRADDLAVLRGWLPAFLRKHDCRFVHVGALLYHKPVGEIIGIEPERREHRPMERFSRYRTDGIARGIDCQLIPLVDHPYNEAKSALKGLEAAAIGEPFIGGGTESYEEVFGLPRKVGWAKAAECMLDPAARRAAVAQQRAQMEPMRIEHRWRDWADLYASLV